MTMFSKDQIIAQVREWVSVYQKLSQILENGVFRKKGSHPQWPILYVFKGKIASVIMTHLKNNSEMASI